MLWPMSVVKSWEKRSARRFTGCSSHRGFRTVFVLFMIILTPFSTSKSFVKKKAALTLLRLYRKYPGIVRNEWAERIISIMDDPDMGVTLSVTSLVMALAQDLPEEYKGCYVKAAQRLKRIVVDNDIAPDYLYYRVPCPWIQVKFLRLLQYYPPSGMFSALANRYSVSHIQLQRIAMFARLFESPSPR